MYQPPISIDWDKMKKRAHTKADYEAKAVILNKYADKYKAELITLKEQKAKEDYECKFDYKLWQCCLPLTPGSPTLVSTHSSP
jgi:hypothetical protein